MSPDSVGTTRFPDAPEGRLVVLLPVFNDWAALAELLTDLGAELAAAKITAHILVVDDGSSTPFPEFRPVDVRSMEILHLQRNVGHQRAIAIGLAYASQKYNGLPVVVMDGDGEDQASHVPVLFNALQRSRGREIVFAERRKRVESISFRLGYWLFRWLHFLTYSSWTRYNRE